MYHIKDDLRCRKSAEKIGEAYRSLLKLKPLGEISITDIQKKSGTGRSTFYRLFDNTDDVLLYIIEEEFRDMGRMYRELDWQDFTAGFIGSIISGSRELSNVAGSGKTHLITMALRRNLTHETEMLGFDTGNNPGYMIAIFVGACLSLVIAWEENGRQESTEELARLMRKALNYSEMENVLKRHERRA